MFSIARPINCITYDAEGHGRILNIKQGSTIRVTGGSPIPNFLEVEHQGTLCYIFDSDFVRECVPLPALGASA